MVIVDEKVMLAPPPPYVAVGPINPPPFPVQAPRPACSFSTLPSHLLLRVVYETFPQHPGIDLGKIVRQRKTLYWMCISLRLVSRALYIACMHILRSSYLPAYTALIRPPYTSDPFPITSASTLVPTPPLSAVQTLQRETHVLDLFLTLKVREDVWADESELHLEREESFKDLFDLSQPRARLEDLIRQYGMQDGVVTVSAHSGTRALPFAVLSVSFSPRRVGIVLTMRERKRTIVGVGRTREETLEATAKKLVKELKVWLASSSHSL